jgi:hypothetical protein
MFHAPAPSAATRIMIVMYFRRFDRARRSCWRAFFDERLSDCALSLRNGVARKCLCALEVRFWGVVGHSSIERHSDASFRIRDGGIAQVSTAAPIPAVNLLMQWKSRRQSCLKIDLFSGDGVLEFQMLGVQEISSIAGEAGEIFKRLAG